MEKIIADFLKSIFELDPFHLSLSFLSILPWGFFLYKLHPDRSNKKFLVVFLALIAGFISTRIILSLHPIIWPEIDFRPRKVSMLTQTVHIAFLQAGMMEETFKTLLIFILGFWFCYSSKEKIFDKKIVLVGGFVALGFSFVENYVYIHKETRSVFEMFIGRAIVSSNIHLLINLCFSLFLLKSNRYESVVDKIKLVAYAFMLAVFQHGVVDFFLLPGSKFGSWLAISLFVGIWVWVVKDMREYVFQKEEVKIRKGEAVDTMLLYRDGEVLS
ncbi:MAG: PrsW family glutamic-type intramembrane protease [Leptospiraceae bacterium]|nr:PrsW family glutamic-type intramembrane protease [Leptospiraceae bacterium]